MFNDFSSDLAGAIQRFTSRSGSNSERSWGRHISSNSRDDEQSNVVDLSDVRWNPSQLPNDYHQIPEGLEANSYQTGYTKALWSALSMANPAQEEMGAVKQQIKLLVTESKSQGKKFQEVMKEQMFMKSQIEELQNKMKLFNEFDLETFHSLNLAMVELVRRGQHGGVSSGGIVYSIRELFASMWEYLTRTLTDAELAMLVLSRKFLLLDLWYEMSTVHKTKKGGQNEMARKIYGVAGSGCYVGAVECGWWMFNRFNDKLPEFMQKGFVPMRLVLQIWLWGLRGSVSIVVVHAFINAWRELLMTAKRERLKSI